MTVFGREAERLSRRFSSNASLLLCDGSNVAEALAEGVRRRREGDTYLVAPLLHDSLSMVARSAASTIYAQFTKADDRRQLFELLASCSLSLNNVLISQHNIYSQEVLNTMREICQLGDGLYARSQQERNRIEALFGRRRLYVAVAPLIDNCVPDIRPNRDATHVLVWAPEEHATDLTLYSYALWHLKLPAIFVCQGQIPNSPHRFVQPDHSIEALKEAAVLVDVQISDPGTAIAFADKGYGIVTATTSGAHEYIQGAATYAAHDFTSIYGAVTRSRGDRRTYRLMIPNAEKTIESTINAAQPFIPEDPPLVSIILPTYNRSSLLRSALESFRKQTYPNIEVIVVNDCGEDVSHIVADYPFARYLCTDANSGCSAAINYGLRNAHGTYLGCVPDDDQNYAGQISSLAAALSNSNLDVAHGNVILRLDTKLADGALATYGHLLQHDGDHDPYSVYWGMPIITQGYLLRKEAWERINFINTDLVCTSDLEINMKLTQYFDFTHVSCLTGEMSYRDDKSNLSSSVGDKLAPEIRSTQKLHAPPESELIALRIEGNYLAMQEAAKLPTYFYPWVPLTNPIFIG
jgi:hypothetical protein